MNKSVFINKICVYISSDHAGFEMKNGIQNCFDLKDFLYFVDLGPYKPGQVDYPDYAAFVAQKVLQNPNSYGIAICGTGIGMCVVLNKFKGIYAANLIRQQEAKLAREHNNINVLALSGRFVTLAENVTIIKTFFAAVFDVKSPRHKARIAKIKKIENQNV